MSDDEKKQRNKEYYRVYRAKNREKILDRSRLWAKNNPEKIKAKNEAQREANKIRARKWRENPDNRKRDIASSREWYYKDPQGAYIKNRKRIMKNHAAYLEYLRQYAQDNAAQASERAKRWKKDNPDKVKLNNAKRKAQKLRTQVGPIDFEEIKRESGMLCGICGTSVEGAYHFDHIVPLAKGGGHVQDNLQITHPRCNLSKKASLNYVSVKQKAPEGAIAQSVESIVKD